MRILFVTRAAPISNARGIDRRAAQHLAALQKLGTVTMVLPGIAAQRAADHGVDLDALGLERLLIRDDPTAVDQSRRRYWRARNPIMKRVQHLRIRQDNDQRVLPEDAASWGDIIGTGFDMLFAFRMASAVWIDSVPLTRRPPLTIVDLDDIESVAFARLRQKRQQSPVERLQAPLFMRWLKRSEADLARRWDALSVCSELDAGHLRRRFGIEPLVVPNAVRFPPLRPQARAPLTRLLFVGTLDYRPNSDGICWFVEHVWPLLRAQLGDAVSLRIAGMSPPPEVIALAGRPGIEVLGRVEDLDPLYAEASMIIVPIFSGGGTRIKLIEALAHSRATVTTSVGCEGLAMIDGDDALIADTPRDFARALLRLGGDATLRKRIAECGWHKGRAAFDAALVETRFLEQVSHLLKRLPTVSQPESIVSA